MTLSAKIIYNPAAGKGSTGKNLPKNDPAVRLVRAIEGSIPAHADGETVCTAGIMVAIELLPGALNVAGVQA